MAVTTIEWTATRRPDGTVTPGFTFNPWRGCTKVSDGCKHCYAETLSGRNPKSLGVWGPRGTRVVAAESYWRQPLKWDAAAKTAGERHRVFCASLADVFEGPESMPAESVNVIEDARRRLFYLIAATPHLDWLLLTKRPENAQRWLAEAFREGGLFAQLLENDHEYGQWLPPVDLLTAELTFATCHDNLPNVWIGASVEDQQTADERIPHLLRCPAKVRFLSCEPLLGPIDLSPWLEWGMRGPPWLCGRSDHPEDQGPDNADAWVIVGGESGPHARPMHPQWARDIRDQCRAVSVAYFFKQSGEFAEATPDNVDAARAHRFVDARGLEWTDRPLDEHPSDTAHLVLIGKKAAGRLLDGRTWDQIPEAQR